MFFHIGSIVDFIPLVLYPRGEVCEEESKELEPNTVIEPLMMDGAIPLSQIGIIKA